MYAFFGRVAKVFRRLFYPRPTNLLYFLCFCVASGIIRTLSAFFKFWGVAIAVVCPKGFFRHLNACIG